SRPCRGARRPPPSPMRTGRSPAASRSRDCSSKEIVRHRLGRAGAHAIRGNTAMSIATFEADPVSRAPEAVRPELLHALFEAQASRRPDHPAIECRGRVLTYRELDRLANRFAHYFRAQGLGPGRLVALHLEKSVELFAALLGVLKAGAGY